MRDEQELANNDIRRLGGGSLHEAQSAKQVRYFGVDVVVAHPSPVETRFYNSAHNIGSPPLPLSLSAQNARPSPAKMMGTFLPKRNYNLDVGIVQISQVKGVCLF